MKCHRLSTFAALAIVTIVLGLAPGRAAAGLVVSFDSSSQVLAGTTPGGTGPWAEAVFTRLGDHEVQVTFSVPTNSVPGLYLDGAGFQFNTSTSPSFVHVSGVTASSASFKSSGLALPGTGNEKLDTDFNFPNAASNRIQFGKDSVYDIVFSSGSPLLTTDLSNLFKTPDVSGHSIFADAHIAGYNGKSVGVTGHITFAPASVPEPSSLVLSGVGIIGFALACVGRRIRKRLSRHRLAVR